MQSDPLIQLSQFAMTAIIVVVVLARVVSLRRLRTGLLALTTLAWIALSAVGVWALAQTAHPAATDPGNPCPGGATVKTFNVSLINIPLFLNRFGDVVPEGRMYILDENIDVARATFAKAADPFDQHDLIEPLAVRVHKGDCVEVNFTNRLNEPAPNFNRNDSIFTLPGEKLLAPGTVSPNPREFAPALTQPDNDFDPANAPPASMHFDGLTYDVKGSDGAAVGNNPNSTVAAGGTIRYRLYADQEGEFQFKDAADLSSQATGEGNFIGSTAFGAFGGIVVERPGTTWVDVRTGEPIKSGTRAVVKDPNGPDFREQIVFMHDEIEAEPGILTRFCIPPKDSATSAGDECVNPTEAELKKLRAGTLPALGGGDADALVNGEVPVKLEWFGFNYRSEPTFNREEIGCPALDTAGTPFSTPACVGEETALSSWPYGDPGGGDLITHSYRGEATSYRLFHPAETETHTFHWHVNTWPSDPADEGGLAKISDPKHHTSVTNPLDVQAVSPGDHYTLIPEGGAGRAHDGKPATFGDVIFHCHLYPHFAAGMWGLNRTHDVLEDGTRSNPDTTPIPALIPLEDAPKPPAPTNEKPGFPFFLPGKFGFKAPKAPLSVPERRTAGNFPPTELEKNAADPGAQVPGGFFQDPCPKTWDNGTPTPLKVFEVSAIQTKNVYSDDLNWNNPQHRMYVLNEDKAAVLNGTKKPEPFAPLLNVGDCVEYRLTNDLPQQFGGTVFDRAQITNEVGIHQHLVLFDVLSSDGAANGWNYDQGADPGQTYTYRDFVGEDVATNSFHDHFFANVHQDNGLWGGSTVHPAGCTFHDPATGAEVRIGTIVDIRCTAATDYHGKSTNGEDYRNVSLYAEDHVPMFRPEDPNDPNDDQFVTPEGVPIYPPKFPSAGDDYGAMGINYRLEPFEARRNDDPANLFDSDAHGDPYTPLPRAFAGDRVKFRVFQLSQEESHGFNLDRWRWKHEPNDPESNIVQAQHIGMLEYFDVKLTTDKEDPNAKALELRDYVYNYGGADDWFLGAWGLFRVAGCNPNDHPQYQKLGLPPLQPLPDNVVAKCSGNKSGIEQRTVGNPCTMDKRGNITAPLRKFTVVAINQDIVYNKAGDHDPNGVMYALEEDLTALQNGTKKPEPLVLRVNAGDCIEVTLKNQLDPNKMKPHCFEATEPGQLGFVDPSSGKLTLPQCLDEPPKNEHNVPGFKPFPVSARVSLRPSLVNYHAGSAGSHVGYNHDSTVGPGESILYRWFAPDEVGMAVLQDRADVQNHLHHGLYGALVVEPAGSKYLDPKDGSTLRSGLAAIIDSPNGDFRENVVFMNSDLSLFRAAGLPVADNLDLALQPSHEADDPEDQGEFSIGYRNEPWAHRASANPDLSLIFSSRVHGDPATPLFRSYSGDPVRFRVAQAVGDPRSTGFTLHGHRWRRSPKDPQSQIKTHQGQFNPLSTYDINLDPGVFGGAGGPLGTSGDYLYRSGSLLRHLNAGQWGIFRVFGSRQDDLIPLPDRPL